MGEDRGRKEDEGGGLRRGGILDKKIKKCQIIDFTILNEGNI